MMELKLTEQERKWAESYVKHLNATQACRDAGFKGSNDVLRQKGRRLVTNVHVQAYMESIVNQQRAKEESRIASIEEVLEFYSKGMRGEIKDQFGLDAQLTDRIKCAQSLDKILQLAKKSEAAESKDELTVEQYYGRDDDGEA